MLPGGVGALMNFGAVLFGRSENSCACSYALGYFVAVSGIANMEEPNRNKTLRSKTLKD